MTETAEYTEAEFKEFRKLVYMLTSSNQLARINARIDMPGFVERVGREKCDAMYARINEEDPLP